MGWFKRQSSSVSNSCLPSDIVDRVIAYMDYEEDPQGSDTPFEMMNQLIYQPLYPIAAADPAAFAADLAAAVLPVAVKRYEAVNDSSPTSSAATSITLTTTPCWTWRSSGCGLAAFRPPT